MSINRVARGGLFTIGLVAGLLFLSPFHEARFERDVRTSHTRLGMASSPWLVLDHREEQKAGGMSSSWNGGVELASWSWAALGVSMAAFWVRRRFTRPEPAGQAAGPGG